MTPERVRGAALAVALVVLAAALVACGDEERVAITGDAYSFEAPEGWDEISDAAIENVVAQEDIPVPPGGSVDSGAVDVDTGASINVVLPGGGGRLLETVDEPAAERLEARYAEFGEAGFPAGVTLAGRPEVVVSDLAGEPVFKTTFAIDGAENGLGDIEQVLARHDDVNYVITVTADGADAAAGAFEDISSTWSWE